MKRFHVHLHVRDLGASVAFYSKLFGGAPARSEADYAKWMLDDPPVNFAISTRGEQPGIDHLGIQVDSKEELVALQARAASADRSLLDEGETTCCYARSEKHWVTDPQGVAWEHFHTLEGIPVFNERPAATGCCAPAASPSASSSASSSASASASSSASASPARACCAPAAPAAPAAARCC